MKKKSLICSCCGADAGRWYQWPNRDAGYGVCLSCVVWVSSRESPEDIEHQYGVHGINYGPEE